MSAFPLVLKLSLFLLALLVAALRRSRRPWAQRLARPVGPRTDVAAMSRAELFRSARKFFGVALIAALLQATVIAIAAAVKEERWMEQPLATGIVMVVTFVLTLATVAALVAAGYLTLRGLLRRGPIPPAPPRPGAMPRNESIQPR